MITPNRYRSLIAEALLRTYREESDLPGFSSDLPATRGRWEPPLSTERAIVARLAIHMNQVLTHEAPFLPADAVVDVEYERLGKGRDPKLGVEHKISPDLIVHRRRDAVANFLAVEVKNAGSVPRRAHPGEVGVPQDWPNRGRLPDRGDLAKLDLLVTGTKRLGAYEMGLCLELDRRGAELWWVTRGALVDERWEPPPAKS